MNDTRHLSDTERMDWLRLIRTDNIGPRTFVSLLRRFKTAAAALEALPALVRRGGGTATVCTIQEAEREIANLARIGARLIALGEPEYPSVLAAADAPPPLLTALGETECLQRPMIGIVGARNASAAGRTFAMRLAQELGEAGLIIVSGLARGIDTSAHQASLTTGTVAVLAGGLDHVYPAENGPLLRTIVANGGAAVTEMPLGWEPRARDFPRRNRIIAGLSRGVVVVEAALRSGSLITARLANEMGREVMAAPGSPLDPRCEGSNRLLRDGATLITSAEHVLEAIEPSLRERLPDPRLFPLEEEIGPIDEGEDSDAVRTRVLDLLGPSPAHVDAIIRLSEAPAQTVQTVLLELELAGRLERHSGGRVSLI